MFAWLQHLFTARALERENAELRLKITQLEAEVTELNKVIAIKDEKIRCLNQNLSRVNANRPRFAEGANENPFGY